MDQGEKSQPKEREVSGTSRSENYMARFLTQTAEAFDTTKPFTLGSPEPLTVTADKLKILDRYSLDYTNSYWSQNERKAMTHDQKLEEFASKWSNAIIKRYAPPKEGEVMDETELDSRKKRSEVLKKLGLDPENMSADAVRKYHKENFGRGKDVNAFITRIRQSLTPEEMRAHLDDIEFVARMFDSETAKDIRALFELEFDENKDNYAKRANQQGNIASNDEKRRLQDLAKYLKMEHDDVIEIDLKSEPEDKIKLGNGSVDKTTGINDVIDIDVDESSSAKIDDYSEQVLDIDAPKAEIDQAAKVTPLIIDAEDAIKPPKNLIDQIDMREDILHIPTKEFPKDAKLYGTEGDNMRIVISEPVLKQINEQLKEMSWADGEFKERGAAFVGKKYKDKDGKIWTDIIAAIPLYKTKSTWGELNYTPESWAEAYDIIDKFLNVDKNGTRRPENEQLELLSWVHTHPQGWEGVMSLQDEKPARVFPSPWNFAYIYAAGLGEDTPVDVSKVSDSEIGKVFAFFSPDASGTNYGTYNKHLGFYTRPKTERDRAYGKGEMLDTGKNVDELESELEEIINKESKG